MERGSKHNLYQCPECNYGTSRKYNLKVHLERMHGLNLSPSLFKSQEEWVWAQRRSLEKAYIEAEEEKEAKQKYAILYNFLATWSDKGYWNIAYALGEVWEAKRRHYEEVAKSKNWVK